MRARIILASLVFLCAQAAAQEDKKTDDLKPADPDTGESTVQETTLGLLPNPYEKQGIKFAVTYIGEILGNPSGGANRARSTRTGSTSRWMPTCRSSLG
jgi:porin